LVTGGRDSDYAADATSDGSTIVFSRLSRDDGRWQLVLADTSGGNEHVVLTERYPIWLPRWSPDDTSVAYAATLRPNVTALFVMDMRTHAIRQLTQTSRASGPYADRVPVWSPDGSTIAFLRLFDDRPWLGTIELLDVGSGDVTPLVVVPRPSSLDWSPVGDTIVFDARGKEGTQDIFTISVSGSPEPMPLVEDLSTDALPAWSPDGRYIAFLSDRAGINDLYVMRADGTGVTRLPTGGGPNGSPEWFVGG
jgi:Tol biopolymer transport system component